MGYTSRPDGWTRIYPDGSTVKYSVVAEVGMLERTRTEVINLRTSINTNDKMKEEIIEIINGWRDIDDSEIEWFKPHSGDERNKKIDKILN